MSNRILVEAPQELRPTDLLGRFDAVAAAVPDRLAVVAADGVLTFGELRTATDRVAALLSAHGVSRGSRVGLALSRSSWLMVALLAVWRRGAAYVPLDPAHPHHRRVHMMTDAGVGVLLTDQPARDAPAGVVVLGVQDTEPAVPQTSVRTVPADPAYVIYTSGSTGVPKGVQVVRGAVDWLVGALEEAGVYPPGQATVAWNASVSFDASVQQWVRVCRGDTVVILSEEQRADADLLDRALREHAVTYLDVTPSHWAALARSVLRGRTDAAPLRLLMGGERLPTALWRDLVAAQPAVRAYNLYGPTECTVEATATAVSGPTPHIGRPLPGTRAYVLDELLRPVGVGVPGEMYLAGPGVAVGYVGRPDLTAERFVADSLAADGSRMYRTGDRVRWTVDGTFEFLGRSDRQVKVRGFRVEPHEVEAVLTQAPGVEEAYVVADRGGDGSGALVAYLRPAAVPVDQVLEFAAARLPAFMVPTTAVALPAFPRTVNGKLDAAALPAPVETRDGSDRAAPSGRFEKLIAAVWEEVLGVDDIAASDDFFALGGHSLVALRVVSRLRRTVGIVMPTKDVYRFPRLCDLAEHVAMLSAVEFGETGAVTVGRQPGAGAGEEI